MYLLAVSTKASVFVGQNENSFIIVCENEHKKAGFITVKAVKNVNFKTVQEFVSQYILAN
jgi:hypothetical protein